MIITDTFDVLVVYSENIATSASSTNKGNTTPFSLSPTKERYASAYSYFLKTCLKFGLKVAFTTSQDITGAGTCSSYWEHKKNKWHKILKNGYSQLIFDKFFPQNKSLKEKRDLLFSSDLIKPFNNMYLLDLFNDKLKTHKTLESYTIPTVAISASTVIDSILELDSLVLNHDNKSDFSKNFILKDRFGSSGVDIYKIGANPIESIKAILKEKPNTLFILQPFTKFDKGYTHGTSTGYTDIRIIYSNGKAMQRYIRTAKKDDFRCNEHQGGKVIYITSKAVPRSVITLANGILKDMNCKESLFALDFIVSNNGNAYFLEGNISPGIYWGDSPIDKIKTKQLVNAIILELKRRTDIRILKNMEIAPLNISLILPSTVLPKLPFTI